MGKQSSRIYFQGKDHKDIWFRGNYSSAMAVGNEIFWKKIYKLNGIYQNDVANSYKRFCNFFEKKLYQISNTGKVGGDLIFFPIKNGMAFCYTDVSNTLLNTVILSSNDLSVFKEAYREKSGYYYQLSDLAIIDDDILCMYNITGSNGINFLLYSFSENKFKNYKIQNANLVEDLNKEISNHYGKSVYLIKIGNDDYEYLSINMEGYSLTKCYMLDKYTDKRAPFLYYNDNFYYIKQTIEKVGTGSKAYKTTYKVCCFNTKNEERTLCIIKELFSSSEYTYYETSKMLRRYTTRVNNNTYILLDRVIRFNEEKTSATAKKFVPVNFEIDKYKNQEKIGTINYSFEESTSGNLYRDSYVIENGEVSRNCMVNYMTENENGENARYIVLIKDLFESNNNIAICFDDL